MHAAGFRPNLTLKIPPDTQKEDKKSQINKRMASKIQSQYRPQTATFLVELKLYDVYLLARSKLYPVIQPKVVVKVQEADRYERRGRNGRPPSKPLSENDFEILDKYKQNR